MRDSTIYVKLRSSKTLLKQSRSSTSPAGLSVAICCGGHGQRHEEETRTCFKCEKKRHLKKDCKAKKKDKDKHEGGNSDKEVILDVQDSCNDSRNDWLLNSGASLHLVNDERLLLDARDCDDEVLLADDEKLALTKVGDVRLFVIADGSESTVKLTNVYFAPNLARNIVNYGKIDVSGYALT